MLVPVIDALPRRLAFERQVGVLAGPPAARLPASASVLRHLAGPLALLREAARAARLRLSPLPLSQPVGCGRHAVPRLERA